MPDVSVHLRLTSVTECFFNGRDTPNDKPFEISKPIIPQLYEKQMAIIRFPHGIDGKLACVGDEKRQKQKKKFSWDSFVLDGKAFPLSRSYKGPLQVIVEPIIEEQHAMRQKKTTPEGLEVFYFKDLRSSESEMNLCTGIDLHDFTCRIRRQGTRRHAQHSSHNHV